ncbi:hypothetical protein M0802_004825 [Mischocyttarus mexicanus]|nr:hypothetical protein M0802_004825 [Mischocyttarus mexicanus]
MGLLRVGGVGRLGCSRRWDEDEEEDEEEDEDVEGQGQEEGKGDWRNTTRGAWMREMKWQINVNRRGPFITWALSPVCVLPPSISLPQPRGAPISRGTATATVGAGAGGAGTGAGTGTGGTSGGGGGGGGATAGTVEVEVVAQRESPTTFPRCYRWHAPDSKPEVDLDEEDKDDEDHRSCWNHHHHRDTMTRLRVLLHRDSCLNHDPAEARENVHQAQKDVL